MVTCTKTVSSMYCLVDMLQAGHTESGEKGGVIVSFPVRALQNDKPFVGNKMMNESYCSLKNSVWSAIKL